MRFRQASVIEEPSDQGDEHDEDAAGALAIGGKISCEARAVSSGPCGPGRRLPVPMAKNLMKQPGNSRQQESSAARQSGPQCQETSHEMYPSVGALYANAPIEFQK